MDIRLGFHTHIPAIEKDGKIYMPGHIGFFVDSIAKNCKEVVCFQHLPCKAEMEQMDYEITSSNIKLVSMCEHSRIPSRTLKAFFQGREIREFCKEIDVMLIRTPTPLLPLFKLWFKEKIVLFAVGDYLSGLDSLNLPRLKKPLIKLWSAWIDSVQRKVISKSLIFVNGKKLYNQWIDKALEIYETRTTTLREKDFFFRNDTCLNKPYKILYCGRMTKDKGLFDLSEAFINLNESGIDLTLELVGPLERGDNSLEVIKNEAKNKGFKDRIKYYGYQPAGDKLLSFYRKADIFVCPTRIISETYPRTIREAMASCVPVIATKVGSLPDYIGHCSTLIEPGDIKGLEDGIKKIIYDGDYRRQLIEKGFEVVKNDTVEKRAEELLEKLDVWAKSGKKRG